MHIFLPHASSYNGILGPFCRWQKERNKSLQKNSNILKINFSNFQKETKQFSELIKLFLWEKFFKFSEIKFIGKIALICHHSIQPHLLNSSSVCDMVCWHQRWVLNSSDISGGNYWVCLCVLVYLCMWGTGACCCICLSRSSQTCSMGDRWVCWS